MMRPVDYSGGEMAQAVGRVGLVVLACELANHQSIVTRLSEALDIHDWDGPADLPLFGLRVAVSHGSGLEIVAPLDAGSAVSAHLRERGEGVFAVVFGVDDLARATQYAAAHGMPPPASLPGLPDAVVIDSLVANEGGPVFPSYPDRFAVHRETVLQQVAGIHVILGQLEPLAAPSGSAVEGMP
jgi:hypothetical protein